MKHKIRKYSYLAKFAVDQNIFRTQKHIYDIFTSCVFFANFFDVINFSETPTRSMLSVLSRNVWNTFADKTRVFR